MDRVQQRTTKIRPKPYDLRGEIEITGLIWSGKQEAEGCSNNRLNCMKTVRHKNLKFLCIDKF